MRRIANGARLTHTLGIVSNMTALEKFEQDLAAIIGNPTDLRPFVCDGSPLNCKAFIVGFNPATEMTADFWSFWRYGFGFDKSAWFAEYLKDRQSRPLTPGKTRRPAVSNSRRVIDWILEEANPVHCLETNIYASPTEQATELVAARRLTTTIDFLLESIKPDVVIVHGKDATLHLQEKRIAAHVISVPHFSRGWSQSDARALGQQIRSKCDA